MTHFIDFSACLSLLYFRVQGFEVASKNISVSNKQKWYTGHGLLGALTDFRKGSVNIQ